MPDELIRNVSGQVVFQQALPFVSAIMLVFVHVCIAGPSLLCDFHFIALQYRKHRHKGMPTFQCLLYENELHNIVNPWRMPKLAT